MLSLTAAYYSILLCESSTRWYLFHTPFSVIERTRCGKRYELIQNGELLLHLQCGKEVWSISGNGIHAGSGKTEYAILRIDRPYAKFETMLVCGG